MKLNILFLLSAVLNLSGCIIVASNGPPEDLSQPVGTNPDLGVPVGNADLVTHRGGVGGNLPPGATPTYRIQPGASTTLMPGQQAGYGITANTGSSYRVVWTGDAGASGTYHEFWGSVWTPGTFTKVTPGCANNACPLEADDYISTPANITGGGQRIDFDTFATTGLDGFDFVASVEPIYFDFYIDGVRYPNLVFFPSADTGKLANTAQFPFALVSGNHHATGGGVPPASTTTYRIKPGASTTLMPGQQAGYGITANLGHSFRLVWTGDAGASGAFHEFWGSVWTGGTFSNVVPGCNGGGCALQPDDWVSAAQAVAGGQRIDFDSITTSGINGFDFIASAEPVFFDLYIDGGHQEQLVFFPATDNGGAVSNVAAIPFGLLTN